MADYDAGKIEATLDVDKTPFEAGLDEAKDRADEFADGDYTATLDADKDRFDEQLDDAKAAVDGFAGTEADAKLGADASDAEAKLAAVRESIREYEDDDNTVYLHANADDADAKIASASDRVRAFGDQSAEANLGIADDDAIAKYEELSAKLDALAARVYSVKVSANDDAAKAKLDELKAQLAILDDEGRRIFNADPSEVDAAIDDMRSKIADADADVNGLSRQLGGASGGFKKLGKDADDAGKDASNASHGMSLLVKAAIGLGPALIPVTAVLGSGLASMLPLLAGATAGLGGIALVAKPAFDAVTTAVGNAQTAQTAYNLAVADGSKSGQAEALAEIKQAFDGLTPAERAAASAYESFTGSYKRWVDSFQPQLFALMTSGFTALRGLLPDLTPLISNSLQAVTYLGRSLSQLMPDLTQFIGYLSNEAPTAIIFFGNIIADLASGFAGLIEAFTPLSNIVATGLLQMAVEFQHWGQTLADNQQFQAFIAYVEREAPIVRQLFDNLGRGVEDLVRAATPLGDALLDAFNAIGGGLSTGGTGSALAAVGRDLGALVTAATPAAKALAEDLGGALTLLAADLRPLLPGVEQLLRNLQPLAKVFGSSFAGGFLSVFSKLAPPILDVANSLATLLDRLTAAHPRLIAFVGTAAGGAYAISKLVGPIRSIVKGLGGMIGVLPNAIKDLGNFGALLKGTAGVEAAGGIGQFARALNKIGTGAAGAVGSLVNGFRQLLAILPGVDAAMVGFDAEADANPIGALVLSVAALGAGLYELVENFTAVSNFLSGTWGTAVSVFVTSALPLIGIPMLVIGHWDALVDFFTGLWGDITRIFDNAATTVPAALDRLWAQLTADAAQGATIVAGFFTNLWAEITGDVARVAATVTGFFTGMWATVSSAVARGASAVVGFFAALPGRILAELEALPDQLARLAGDAIGYMVIGLLTQVAAVYDFFSKLVPAAVSRLAGWGAALAVAAGNAMEALLAGLVNAAGDVWDFFTALPGRVLGYLEALPGDLRTVGDQAISGMAAGLRAAWGAVTGFVSAIPRVILGLLSTAGGWLVGTGEAVIDGMAAGLKRAFGAVTSFVGKIPGVVIGALSSAATWLVATGEAVINGLVAGISKVFGAIGMVVSEIPGVVAKAVSGAGSWLFNAGVAVIEGFVRGIESMAGSVTSAIEHTITSHLPGFVKSALGISSPSKVFYDIGVNIMQGLANGILDNGHLATSALAGVKAQIATPIKVAANYSLTGASLGAGALTAAAPAGVVVQGGNTTVTVAGTADATTVAQLKQMLDQRDAALIDEIADAVGARYR